MVNIVVPCDFVVLDMVELEDPYTPLISGRYSLKTLNALIDCKSEIITLRVAHEKVGFAFVKSSKEPMVEHICFFKVVEGIVDEKVEGYDVFVAPVFDEEFDAGEKK